MLSVLIINKDRDSHGGIMINRLKTNFSVLFNDQGVLKMKGSIKNETDKNLAQKKQNFF